MKRLFIHFVILTLVTIFAAGCSVSNPTASKEKTKNTAPVSSRENGKNFDTDSNNINTVKTFAENELTTSSELKEALNKSNMTALNQYLKEHYKGLIAKEELQTFINTNKGLMVLLPAYSAGYDLKPTHIEIQKDNKFTAFTFKAEVDYSKDGKTNSSTVTGYITLNDNGKITGIRNFDYKELQNIFAAAKAKKDS